MATSLEELDLPRARELGKYTDGPDSQNERRHEKSRVLETEELEIIERCWGCGKHMTKVKSRYICSCKREIHCSKDCFKSSTHKCPKEEPKSFLKEFKENMQDHYLGAEEKSWEPYRAYKCDLEIEAGETVLACTQRYMANISADRSPSSGKRAHLMKITRGDHRRILKYAEAGNAMAAFVIGEAYTSREFDRKADFAIPAKYKEESTVIETNKIAVKWLKVAAEVGVPEAMFCLFSILNHGLNPRVADYWLAKAHATGQMDYLRDILEFPMGWMGESFPLEFDDINIGIINGVGQTGTVGGETLAHLLIATRFEQLKMWGGKTAMGEPFYGWNYFCKLAETIGELKKDQAKPSFIFGEKKTLAIVVTRPGFTQDKFFTSLRREENNLKFRQGIKDSGIPDYKLASQISHEDGRIKHFITCHHDQAFFKCLGEVGGYERAQDVEIEDASTCFNTAGGCESCVEDAKQRLRAVSLGHFSISLTQVFPPGYYAARYAKEDGVIVQDVFKGYSKPYMRQVLQCLMTNPADLHPLAIAENSVFFWPIIWFWGSIYGAVQDACDATTLNAIYRGLGDLGEGAKDIMTDNASALAAFPEAAAGEWRIACGNEDCPKVDHEVKFYICKGYKVRRYCDPACQRKDWPKHLEVCKAGKKGRKNENSSK